MIFSSKIHLNPRECVESEISKNKRKITNWTKSDFYVKLHVRCVSSPSSHASSLTQAIKVSLSNGNDLSVAWFSSLLCERARNTFEKLAWHGKILLSSRMVRTYIRSVHRGELLLHRRWSGSRAFHPLSHVLADRKLHPFARQINFEQSTRARLSRVFRNFLSFLSLSLSTPNPLLFETKR